MNRAVGRTPSATANVVLTLEAIARLGAGATATEICEYLRMPSATAYRILNSLVADEFIVRTLDLKGFELGAALNELILAASPPRVSSAAVAAISDFRARVRFGVHVIEFRASKLRIADQDNDLPLRATADLLRHLHASAAGKLLLSSEQEWRDALPSGRLARLTPRTVTDPDQIANTLDKVRSEGFAAQVDELELGLCCLAAPISLTEQRALAAVCLSGPSERFGSLLDHIEDAKKLALELAPLLY